MNIRFLKLNDKVIKALKDQFNWAFFSEGLAKMSETQSGGIASFGKQTIRPCVSFEILISRIYVMITLGEYAKGCIIHFHFMHGQIDRISKSQRDKIVKDLYEKVFEICQNAVGDVKLGRSST